MEPVHPNPSAEAFIPAVESTFTERFGGPVQLSSEDVLGGSDRSRVLRCRISEGPEEAPASVIIKHVQGDANRPYDPDDARPHSPAWRFFNDWTGAQFLSSVAGDRAVCPRFYGGDRAKGFIILEDFGEGESLADLLLGEDPARAEQGLVALAATLGRMHAATIGREAEYRRLRDTLVASPQPDPAQSDNAHSRFREGCDALAITLTPSFEADLGVVTDAMREPGPFLAYTHGDPCPDNNRVADGQLRLFDFEFGAFRHALGDGVYGHVPFPTCWCVNRLPAEIPSRMEAAYRLELMKGCPEAADDTRFHHAVVEASAHWILETTGWHLRDALKEDGKWGISTPRQRLILRLDNLAALTAAFGYLEALGATAQEIAAHLRARWPAEAAEMPLYPAFRNSSAGVIKESLDPVLEC
jgi:hypothetical protein